MKTIPWHIKARQLMQAKNIKGYELAAAIDKSGAAVSQYLSGKRQPPTSVLKEIAAVLEVTIANLVEDDVNFAATEAEKNALEIMRSMSKEKQQIALSVLAALKDEKGAAKE